MSIDCVRALIREQDSARCAGIRGFEFDSLDDPQGGKYADSAVIKLTGAATILAGPDLLKPGMHVAQTEGKLG